MQGELGKDDVVNYWSWMTFSWMTPFIMFASKKELDNEDLPQLSRTMRTQIVLDKLKATQGTKVLWRIVKANRLDIGLDISLTIVSVFFNYLGPYFLQSIL